MYFVFLALTEENAENGENTENTDTPIDTTPKKNTDMKSMIAALKQQNEAANKQGKLIPINCRLFLFLLCIIFFFTLPNIYV